VTSAFEKIVLTTGSAKGDIALLNVIASICHIRIFFDCMVQSVWIISLLSVVLQCEISSI
jgi:hypothetical protein